jgi:hypothetical protein
LLTSKYKKKNKITNKLKGKTFCRTFINVSREVVLEALKDNALLSENTSSFEGVGKGNSPNESFDSPISTSAEDFFCGVSIVTPSSFFSQRKLYRG